VVVTFADLEPGLEVVRPCSTTLHHVPAVTCPPISQITCSKTGNAAFRGLLSRGTQGTFPTSRLAYMGRIAAR
jgi:hypothetical protein